MKMILRIPATLALALAMCAALSGCFGMNAPEPTSPPEKIFASIPEFSDAVAKARADTTAEDAENLKGLTGYYQFQVLPEDAALTSVMASTEAVRVRYAFGPTSEDTFDNQMELGWYRKADPGVYMSNLTRTLGNSGVNYETLESGGIAYIHFVPVINVLVTPEPGVTPAATPTPTATTYCRIVYWVQDGAAFIAALPVGFTGDDIAMYCRGEKVALAQ